MMCLKMQLLDQSISANLDKTPLKKKARIDIDYR